jgi:hypothetical protein
MSVTGQPFYQLTRCYVRTFTVAMRLICMPSKYASDLTAVCIAAAKAMHAAVRSTCDRRSNGGIPG